ncbi:MAG: putative two-component system sensor kinase, partial [Bryobacterales bacterium]|nr:putative two-component system sensor kinase [Bryobacterales bacterium]
TDGLGSDTVGALLRDQNGNLWIGTLHGLSRFDSSGIHNYTVAQGLSGNIITDLYQDRESNLWIATQDGGLNRYRDGAFTSFTPSVGLPQTIYGITEDRGGNFWLAAKNGVFRVSRNELNQYAHRGSGPVSVVAYGPSDGLRVSECSGAGHPAVWKAANGDIWFATSKGAALLAADVNVLNRIPPPVAIETVSIDDTPYTPDKVKEVSPGHSRISFEYAGLSFAAPQKVQFKYRLEGFDQNWIEAGTRRIAYYTNLPAKNYRFRVIARNNDGFWNESGVSLPIRVLPHFYQTWWFYLLVLCACSLAAYGAYFWRLRQVQSQFDAVLAERTRIAREIHDTLAQGFVAVSVQLELVSRFLSSATETAREHLDQARILVRSSLSEARQSIWELRSQEAEVQDFAGRFLKFAQQVTESGPAKVQLEVHGEYRPLKRAVEDELFRIGQEAITNAVRHSGAQHIRVGLTFGSRKLRMTVVDNGSGFAGDVNSQGPNGHFGLKGMRERAERIHAELNIESKLGTGTTVSVEAPAR